METKKEAECILSPAASKERARLPVLLSSVGLVFLNVLTTVLLKRYRLSRVEIGAAAALAEAAKVSLAFALFLLLEERKKIRVDLKYVVPSALITTQSIILATVYQQMENIVFQLCFQSRILFVFAISLVVFRRKYSVLQYLAQAFLVAGLVLMVFSNNPDKAGASPHSAPNALSSTPVHAIVLAFASSLMNAFSSVYFELLMKKSGRGVWENAFLLGIFSLLFSAGYTGYNLLHHPLAITDLSVLLVYVAVQALYGLTTSWLVMRSSAVLKVLLNTVSITITTLVSIYWFGEAPSLPKLLSAAFVIAALALFNCRRLPIKK